ncbi:hypothetical protein [Tropicibacter naphthalenivorans]|nr:hypothetical protein [Tropicibacter naphthalenivorans]
MLADQEMKTGTGGEGTMGWILVGAVTLSAVSFSTTMFGMADFASQQQGSGADALVSWFISLGSTFGVQIIMLYISLKLGEQLVRMRPTFDERIQGDDPFDASDRPARKTQGKWGTVQRLFLLIVVTGLIAVSLMVFLQISLRDLMDFFTALQDGSQEVSRWIGLLPLGLAFMLLVAVGVIKNVWDMSTSALLLGVYFVTLSISSLFSFDSYYKLFQDEEDIIQRRASIIQEVTSKMLIDANISLNAAAVGLLEDPQNAAALREVETALDGLQADRDEVVQTLLDRQAAGAEAARDQRATLTAELKRLNDEEAEEIALVTQNSTAGVGLSQQIRTLEPQIAALEAQRDQITASIQAKREEVTVLDARLECERTGFKGPPHCENASGIANPPDFDPATRPGTFSGRLFIAKNKAEGELQQLEAQLTSTTDELTTLAEEKQALELQLQLANAAVAQDADGNSEALNEIAKIRERFNTARQTLRDSFAQGSPVTETTAPVSLDQLTTLLGSFRNNPTNATFDAWSTECTAVRQSLVQAGSNLASSLNCQPARLDNLAQRGTDIEAAQQTFVDRACATAADPAETPSVAPPDLTDLRALTAQTRGCLNLANRGQEDVREMIAELTELESVYLSDESDIRRSVDDFFRGAGSAQAAMLGAVTVDMLILVVGFLAALSAHSSLYGNPLKPMPDEVKASICALARNFSGDGTVETGLRRFLRYIEVRRPQPGVRDWARREAWFRNTLNRRAVTEEDRELVSAIMTAIPLGNIREVPYYPPLGEEQPNEMEMREGISQSVIRIMTELAFQNGQPAPTNPEATSEESFAKQDARARAEEQKKIAALRQRMQARAQKNASGNTDAPPRQAPAQPQAPTQTDPPPPPRPQPQPQPQQTPKRYTMNYADPLDGPPRPKSKS